MVVNSVRDEERVRGCDAGIGVRAGNGKGWKGGVGAEQGEELGGRDGGLGIGLVDGEDAEGVGEEESFDGGELEVFAVEDWGERNRRRLVFLVKRN